jgi:hypothetical protein
MLSYICILFDSEKWGGINYMLIKPISWAAGIFKNKIGPMRR